MKMFGRMELRYNKQEKDLAIKDMCHFCCFYLWYSDDTFIFFVYANLKYQ